MTEDSLVATKRKTHFRVRFIVDEEGRKKAAVFDIAIYRKLMNYLEDLEDRLFIESQNEDELSYRPYEELRKELADAGRL